MKKLLSGALCCAVFILQVQAQQKPVPGKSFRDCKDCPDMQVLPAGVYTIGTPETEAGRSATEGPVKQISVQSFAVAKYDVTKDEWAAFVTSTKRPTVGGCAFSGFKDSTKKDWEPNASASWNHLGFAQTGEHPVVCITWQDAVDYTLWLSKKQGLPTAC